MINCTSLTSDAELLNQLTLSILKTHGASSVNELGDFLLAQHRGQALHWQPAFVATRSDGLRAGRSDVEVRRYWYCSSVQF